MSDKIKSWVLCHRWFLGFSMAFSALMAFVFWGTWSPDVSPVMPDDSVSHPLEWIEQFRGWWRGFLTNGKFVPSDVIWKGLVLSRYWTQEFKYAFSCYCAALGLAYFLRGRGLSRLASYGGGTLLGLCGYWLTLFSAGHGGWFIWMTYGTFAFGLADRAIRDGAWRHWILLGACVAWGSFYQPDLWFLFTAMTGVYALFVCACEKKFPLKGLLVAAMTFAVIGAPSVYDAFTGSLAARDQQIAETVKPPSEAGTSDSAERAKAEAEARWIFTTNWSLPPDETAEFFIPRLNGDTSCPMTLQLARAAGKDTKPYTGALGRPLGAERGNYRQHSLYVGWVTCLLALAGTLLAFKGPSRRTVWFFAAAAILCWVFSMGRYCESAYRVVYALPFGDYLRAPVKWHHLTEFSLCVLAGFGIEALLTVAKKRWMRLALVAFVAFGAVDLARVNKLYCAPIDLRLVRGCNAAADFVVKAGRGKVADLVENGQGLLAWSFSAHGVSVTAVPNEDGVRFVWAGLKQVAQNKGLDAYLRARARPVGYYRVTGRGVFSVAPTNADVALYQLKDVPAPEPKSPWGVFRPSSFVMGLVSVLGTLAAVGWGVCRTNLGVVQK